MQSISLLESKCRKYLTAIANWRKRPTHNLKEMQKLYGKLLHASHPIKEGCAYLTDFERMFAALQKKPCVHRTFPRTLLDDLQWWTELLSSAPLTAPISGKIHVVDITAFSDMNTSGGLSIIIGNCWCT